MSSTRYIRAPEGTKYLKDIFTDGLLPQNCVFNKVLTGCGGSYIKEYLQSLGITNAKATTLSRWYVIKRVVKNGTSCYRIIQRLTDNFTS